MIDDIICYEGNLSLIGELFYGHYGFAIVILGQLVSNKH
jgi:hypothetical protein